MLQKAKKTALELIQKYKHAWVLLYVLIYFPWFRYLETHVTTQFNVIHMKIDDYIPFIEYFIVPYLLWFGYVAYAVLYFFFKNKNDYYKLCTFLITGMTIFLIVSTLYPNGQHLRPQSFAHDNIFVTLVQWVYETDTPTNLFPSIHVYNSLGIYLAVTHNKKLHKNKLVCLLTLILTVSIILATMFIKQHSFFDVCCAFVLAAVMYHVVYRHNWARAKATATSSKTDNNFSVE